MTDKKHFKLGDVIVITSADDADFYEVGDTAEICMPPKLYQVTGEITDREGDYWAFFEKLAGAICLEVERGNYSSTTENLETI